MNDLSRRDYFAAAALTGILANSGQGIGGEYVVQAAYLLADAMIEAGQVPKLEGEQ